MRPLLRYCIICIYIYIYTKRTSTWVRGKSLLGSDYKSRTIFGIFLSAGSLGSHRQQLFQWGSFCHYFNKVKCPSLDLSIPATLDFLSVYRSVLALIFLVTSPASKVSCWYRPDAEHWIACRALATLTLYLVYTSAAFYMLFQMINATAMQLGCQDPRQRPSKGWRHMCISQCYRIQY